MLLLQSPCRPLRGLEILLVPIPSHEWLGYYQIVRYADDTRE
jgi:hypothetical protein